MNKGSVIFAGLVAVGISILNPCHALGGWKAVKGSAPSLGNDQESLYKADPHWFVTGSASVVAAGIAAEGNARITLADYNYDGGLLTFRVDAAAQGKYIRQFTYIAEPSKPIGAVEYSGKAYARFEGDWVLSSKFLASPSSKITVKADEHEKIAEAATTSNYPTTLKEHEVEDSVSLEKCPAKSLSITFESKIIMVATAEIGTWMNTWSFPQGLQTEPGGRCDVDANTENSDEAISMLSLEMCPG